MSQESNNRARIIEEIRAYMRGLPEPKELPAEIEIKIKYKEGTERHVISLG